MKRILSIMIGLSLAAQADFVRDDAAQIVTDTRTGLQWQDNNDAKTVTKKWTEAISYCEDLNLGGHADWRLPNVNELLFLADRSKHYPAISSVFQNIVLGYYWSSTAFVGDDDHAWLVSFYDGFNSAHYKPYAFRVRCVRAGQ